MTESPSKTGQPAKPAIIALTGFMGSGKSSVGQALALLLGWNFIDLDAEIERDQRQTIREIFSMHGEDRFREIEAKTLRSVLAEARRPLVLATGGGTFVQSENAELLRAWGVRVVFLSAPAETLLRRCGCNGNSEDESLRPLARDRDAFVRLYEQRLPFYRIADIIVDSDVRPPEEVAREIATALRLADT